MTDHIIDHTDYSGFTPWALEQIRSGRCAKIQCPEYDHSIGPRLSKEPCRECYKRMTGK